MIDPFFLYDGPDAEYALKMGRLRVEQRLFQRDILTGLNRDHKLLAADGRADILKLLSVTAVHRVCNTQNRG